MTIRACPRKQAQFSSTNPLEFAQHSILIQFLRVLLAISATLQATHSLKTGCLNFSWRRQGVWDFKWVLLIAFPVADIGNKHDEEWVTAGIVDTEMAHSPSQDLTAEV